MEYVILFAIIIAYSSISGELSSIKKKLNTKKTTWNLKDYVGKKLTVNLDDEFEPTIEGVLVSYDQKWIEIKNKKEIFYKRIEKIKSITEKK